MRKKHILLIFSILVFFFSLFLLADAASDDLANKLSGRILLQVESHGEAWYINPETKERNYLGRPDDAFNVMRQAGIGAKNSDLDRIPVALDNLSGEDSDSDGLPDNLEVALGLNPNNSDSDGDSFSDYVELQNSYNPLGTNKLSFDNSFSKAQAGRILLQVERNGEAWYINPENNKRYFLGRPSDAYNLMRRLGLGISNENLEQINQNQFSHQFSSQNGTETESEDELGEDSSLMQNPSVSLDDFQDELLNCEIGAEKVYSLETELNMFDIILASKVDNKIRITDGNTDSCQIDMETIAIDVSIKNLEEVVNIGIGNLKSNLASDTDKTEEYFDNLFSLPIKDISEAEKNIFLDNGLDEDTFNVDNEDEILYDVIYQKSVEHLENEMQYNEEMETMKKVCIGSPRALLDYLVFVTNEYGEFAGTCLSDGSCQYENGVVCTSLATE